MTNADISQWIDNDEGLYNWWKQSRQPKRKFIQENKEELARLISNVINGKSQAHSLAYGPAARYTHP
jgi:hypothetical protein